MPELDGTVMVECRNVEKRFYYFEHRTTSLREWFIRTVLRKPVHVRGTEFRLTGFDLTVRRGEAVALIGENGSGKSTALRLIAGVYAPTSGTVRTRGRMTAVVELGVGFHQELTGTENVALYAAVLGLTRRELAKRLPAILEFADIGEFVEMPVKYYSSGMHARLAFSVALCVEPDVMLLDEVLAVGDQAFREQCLQRLEVFRNQGGTLVVVAHDFDNLRRLCSRAVWLHEGRVRMTGDVDEVFDAYAEASAVEQPTEGPEGTTAVPTA